MTRQRRIHVFVLHHLDQRRIQAQGRRIAQLRREQRLEAVRAVAAANFEAPAQRAPQRPARRQRLGHDLRCDRRHLRRQPGRQGRGLVGNRWPRKTQALAEAAGIEHRQVDAGGPRPGGNSAQ
jgi:hypothetical protein